MDPTPTDKPDSLSKPQINRFSSTASMSVKKNVFDPLTMIVSPSTKKPVSASVSINITKSTKRTSAAWWDL
jgi:hypothetical protein